jgi:hypothetical protein
MVRYVHKVNPPKVPSKAEGGEGVRATQFQIDHAGVKDLSEPTVNNSKKPLQFIDTSLHT